MAHNHSNNVDMGVISNAIYFPSTSRASTALVFPPFPFLSLSSWQSDLLSLTRTTAPPSHFAMILQTLQHGAAHLCSFPKALADPESVLVIWRINVSLVLSILHITPRDKGVEPRISQSDHQARPKNHDGSWKRIKVGNHSK